MQIAAEDNRQRQRGKGEKSDKKNSRRYCERATANNMEMRRNETAFFACRARFGVKIEILVLPKEKKRKLFFSLSTLSHTFFSSGIGLETLTLLLNIFIHIHGKDVGKYQR